jgi:adenylate cyclase
MADEGFKRKLTAILSADVIGYSRLMRDDEEATVRDIAAHRVLISDIVKKHHGRVVDSPGDNILAEFASVVDAVNGAIKIQGVIKSRNKNTPKDRRMEFRIGINLGDVIEEEERIYGDGVNIAARVEGLASAGGIAISGTVYEHIKEKLSLGYHYLGEQDVKNISEPVRVYRLLTEPDNAGKMIGEEKPKSRRSRYIAFGVIGLIILVVGIFVIWNNCNRSKIEPASIEKMAHPLPDKPSIAVLPFDNLSGDPKQDFFSDGLTTQIISSLSKVPRLFVIASNSTFVYKGKPVEVRQVAEDLGVKYVLEGKAQKSDDRIRITAQLIDTITGRYIWSDSYDRELNDIFELQDEITLEIVRAMRVKLTEGEQILFWKKGGTNNINAFLKGIEAVTYVRQMNIESNTMAHKLSEEAIAIDPDYALVYTVQASAHMMDVWLGTSKSKANSLKTAAQLLQKAIDLDATQDYPHALFGYLYSMMRKYDKAIEEGERAIELNPNSADAYAWLSSSLRHTGRLDDALVSIKKAMRLSPFPPSFYLLNLGQIYRDSGMYAEAISVYKKLVTRQPNNIFAHIGLTSCYSLIGKDEEAQASASEVLRINPKFSVEKLAKATAISDKSVKALFIDSLRKAGLPDNPPLPLPDKPSIAVLAFDDLSGDPEQEYFSDGISENIITALSKVGELFVIARNSSFTYKGKPVKVQQISRELGVRYVLEGSVQKSGDRVRITAQLIDTKNGQHLWADKYDRDLKDIFEIQDEITLKIVNGLQIQLTEGEHARIWSKHNCSLGAYLKATEAQSIRHKGTKEAYIRYGQIGQEIVEAEPECLMGYSILAWYNATIAPFSKSPKEFYEKAFKYAQKGLSIDDLDPSILRNAGLAYLMKRAYEKAIEMGQRAVNMAPNGAEFHAMLGFILSYAGMPDKGIVHGNQAIRLDPFPQVWPYATLGRCHLFKGQYDKSLEAYRKALKISPDNTTALGGIIAAYSMLGREEDAHREAKRLLELVPGLNVALLNFLPLKNQEDRNLFINAWLKAGIPDKRQTAQQNEGN